MHWDILDTERTQFLQKLSFTKTSGFYLAGGTALALYLGHRDSIDFDFFKEGSIDPDEIFSLLEEACKGDTLTIIQKEKDTLSVLVNNTIKLSFFGYRYPLLLPLTETSHITLASLRDIAVMKLAAITSRSLEKDYVDLYYILQTQSLEEMFDDATRKLPQLDRNVILKALVYFDDVEREHIIYKDGCVVEFSVVQDFLRRTVRSFIGE